MNLKELAAAIKGLRQERSQLTKQADELGSKIADLEKDLIDLMTSQGVDKFSSEGFHMALKIQRVPAVEDWDALHAYVYSHHAAHVFQRRLSATAIEELADSGEDVPGINWVNQPKVSYRLV
jgi:hypothetical protein